MKTLALVLALAFAAPLAAHAAPAAPFAAQTHQSFQNNGHQSGDQLLAAY